MNNNDNSANNSDHDYYSNDNNIKEGWWCLNSPRFIFWRFLDRTSGQDISCPKSFRVFFYFPLGTSVVAPHCGSFPHILQFVIHKSLDHSTLYTPNSNRVANNPPPPKKNIKNNNSSCTDLASKPSDPKLWYTFFVMKDIHLSISINFSPFPPGSILL
jgi:hypothetical protein